MVDAETVTNSGRKFDLDKIRNFKVRDDDIYLVTFPKSGFSWMKEILPLVVNGGRIDAIKDVPPDVRIPYLEFVVSADSCPANRRNVQAFNVPEGYDLDKVPSPRIIGSHLRHEFLPKGIEEKKPKVIYVVRNPKDVCVSAYYFSQLLLRMPSRDVNPYKDFNEFFSDALESKNRSQRVFYDGSKWHEHVLQWWVKRHDKNVLFLKYEYMKKDLKCAVRQIAEFLEVELSVDALEMISTHCSFDSMKENKMALKGDFCEKYLNVGAEQSPFVRKGKVGGWKNYFTVAQNELYDELYREWTKDSDLEMTFEL